MENNTGKTTTTILIMVIIIAITTMVIVMVIREIIGAEVLLGTEGDVRVMIGWW